MKQFGHIFKHRGLQFSEATSTLIGSVVGAGVLGIPFAIAQVGFRPGIIMLIALTGANIILQLMYVEIVLRTSKDHEIPGYGSLYLGKRIGMIALLIGILSGYGTLLAYIIGQGGVVSALVGGPPVLWSLLFAAAGGYIVYRGLSAVRVLELIMTVGIFIVVFLIGLRAHPHIDTLNLSYADINNVIVPYGVLLFALGGLSSIPQIRQEMRREEHDLPWVIILGNMLIFIIYAAFIWLVLGVTGAETTEVGTVGLGEKIGPIMVILGNAFAFLTITTSFITVGLSIRRLFQYDYGLSRLQAWLSTMIIPLVIFLLGARSFIQVLSIVGGLIIGAQSAIVIFAFWEARKEGNRKPEFSLGTLRITGIILLIFFAVGAALTLVDLL